jgi:hypothetical protein
MTTILSSSGSALLSCHDLLKYRCDCSEHIVQRRNVYIMSRNCLTWYLVVPQGRRGRPVQPWADKNPAVGALWAAPRRRTVLRWCGWKGTPVCCSLWRSLRLSLYHLFPGVAAASIVGGMRFLSVHQLAVAACRYRWCIALFRAPLVQVTAPHHIRWGGCLQLAQTWPIFWQL